MPQPILVLQYPDARHGKTVAIAATRDWEAMVAFKRAALAEARLAALRWEGDELLELQGRSEVARLEALLAELIPDEGNDA